MNDHELSKILFYLKLAVLFISLVYVLNLYRRMVLSFQESQNNPLMREISTSLIEPEPFNLIVCVYLDRFVDSFVGKRLSEIERLTDHSLDDVLEGIYLEYQNSWVKANWSYEVPKEVLFFAVCRCFQVRVVPEEPKYRRLLSISKLVLKFKSTASKFFLFLLGDEENFNQATYLYDQKYTFVKVRSTLSRLNRRSKCIDYKQRHSFCNSRFHCIDRCIHRTFHAMFGNITYLSDSPIDKDFFSEEEWSQLFLDNSNQSPEIKKSCIKKFPDIKRCKDVRFDNNAEAKTAEEGRIQLEIYHALNWLVEEEPSCFRLVLDILNIQMFFFGNPLKLIGAVIGFIRVKLKIRDSRIGLLVTYLVNVFD